MDAKISARARPGERAPPAPGPALLGRLLPPGDPATAEQVVDQLRLGDRAAARPERPYVLLNMVSTADGRASIGGRSGPVAGSADKELFFSLRGGVDAVMVGAGTVRVERYGRILRDESRRRMRRERGLSEEPLACIVSGQLSLGPDIPLLADPEARVAIVTSSEASLPGVAAHLEYVRAHRDGSLDLPAALAKLREQLGVRTLLCEGGPHLNLQLLAAGLVDELFLSLAPKLAGGGPGAGQTLRILAGAELEPPIELELLGALEHDSYLFLRYGVRASASARVSRETALRSSLAS